MKQLHSAQDAIEQAIEGGYDYSFAGGEFNEINSLVVKTDPLFWQALGKARGWEQVVDMVADVSGISYGWKHYARNWFENRMVGGSEEKYWQSLP